MIEYKEDYPYGWWKYYVVSIQGVKIKWHVYNGWSAHWPSATS